MLSFTKLTIRFVNSLRRWHMIIGMGIDITELDRIERAWQKHELRFAKRILHPTELERLASYTTEHGAKSESSCRSLTEKHEEGSSLCQKKSPMTAFLAARFAAKEAAVKALGTGFSEGIGPCDIEVYSLPSGQPMLRFHGSAAQKMEALEAAHAHISLTHGRDTAAAVVIIER